MSRPPSAPARRPRPPRRLPALVPTALVLAGFVAAAGSAQEPLPAPATSPALPEPPALDEPAWQGFPPRVAPGATAWPRWFAGATGLVMTRTLPAGAATMQPVDGTQLSTAAAGATWPGGVDLHLGRWFGPQQRHAVEFIYWGVYNLGGTGSVTSDAAAITAIPQAPGATFGGVPASSYLVDASGQQIARSDVVNDVEVNWIYALGDRPEFQPRDRAVSLMWLAGFRFFQVNDTLALTTVPGDPTLAPALLSVATNNDLYGGQVGAKFDWRVLPRLRFNTVPKFLIGGNAITNTTGLADRSGQQAVYADGTPVHRHETLGVFSWLGSVDTGLAWDVTDHWTLSLGYRVVGVGNIAQADGQWPSSLDSAASCPCIAAGSSTIIHGGFAGFEGRY